MVSNSTVTGSDNDLGDGSMTHAPVSVWIGLIIIAAISFWCQAVVTEERFVPALNVIAEQFNIPNDVAGATLMAAGASSPELCSSFISLFITHSALGLGTIVGSEIFNQLIICAGAVNAARNRRLHLDPVILIREVSFYGLSILLFYLAMIDHRPVDDDPSGEDHVYISFGQSCMVFGGYILYVVVLAKTDAIVTFFSRSSSSSSSSSSDGDISNAAKNKTTYGAVSRRVNLAEHIDGTMPFLKQVDFLEHEPESNFAGDAQVVTLDRTVMGDRSGRFHEQDESNESITSAIASNRGSSLSQSLRNVTRKYSDRASLRTLQFLIHTEMPSHDRGLYDIESNSFEDRLSCFLWQRSYFYSKARFAVHGWHLRWFTFTSSTIHSIPDRTNSEKHMVGYPPFHDIQIDDSRLIIRIVNANPPMRSYFWMAPSKDILHQVESRLELILKNTESNAAAANDDVVVADDALKDKENFKGGNEHPSLIEFPVDGSNIEIVAFVALFPFRYLMHATMPDVRDMDQMGNPTATLGKASLSIFSCLLWLVIGSYAMVASLESLADLMDIPDAVVGVTVSAAGTSLPNYVASKVAAEKGFGNMAVSNAFGSNTFNIMVGLGLPWVLYTSFVTGFQPYTALKDEGITSSVVIMATVLFIFVVLIIPSKFIMYQWHGTLFVLLYVAYLVYAIGSVYW